MISEALHILSGWGWLDNWIVVTAALAAMACALPGNYLVLRRQSLMGDALSHTVLPGIMVAFLASNALEASGWISTQTYMATQHLALFLGALVIGIFSAVLTEWVQNLGRVESSAALGVVFTTLFAVGLLLVRAVADDVHIDPDCVLYGQIETVVMDTYGRTGIPRAAVLNGSALAMNLLLMGLFYKELRLSAFDPALGTALGINSRWMHYGLMAATAATLVSAFESVGSILVIAMLIVPPATAYLLTDRLGIMIALSLLLAAATAVIGHGLALTAPPLIFGALGFETVVDASTAGMMAVASGGFLVLAMLFGPRHGCLSKAVRQARLSLSIVCEDLLGLFYRLEEMGLDRQRKFAPKLVAEAIGTGRLFTRLAIWRLKWGGQLFADDGGFRLTETGRQAAKNLVRAHRLWESYMAKHFSVPDDHLHETASRVEHYIDADLQDQLETELNRPDRDPHGQDIPSQ